MITSKLKELRQQLKIHQLDGFLIPSNDEFQSEYIPEHSNRLKFITNFSGSNGLALITEREALFFTDGRYLLQAKQELNDSFNIQNIATLYNNPSLRGKIGYDPKLHTENNISRYQNCNLTACENLIDLIWQDKPSIQPSQIFTYPLKYAGQTSLSKQDNLQKHLKENNLDALVITDPANICWLLNIRAHDIAYNPILLSYLIFHKSGELELFANATSIPNISKLKYHPFADFSQRLKLLENKQVQLDPDSASSWVSNHFKHAVFRQDPCILAKSCKNKIEIKQARQVHINDGVAVCKLLYWLTKNYVKEKITEISVAQQLLKFRATHPKFLYPSFPTIAGFAEHGAIIHYNANKNSNTALTGNGLFLLDSGGQYFGGTTDITRVIAIGRATYQQKLDFTLVLKGHIALANSHFIQGTSGTDLDILARQFLWQHGKDYAHGTGHGVGNCLSVHEGPQRISKAGNCPLKPGMILSNEPGYYKNGEYGIRIENLMLVTKISNGFLKLETLTLAPIELSLILTKLLSQDEKQWLNSYHQRVYTQLAPLLSPKEQAWLKQKTAAL